MLRGIYILVILLKKNITVKVGKLGKLKFDKGRYFYVGSGQNNLEKRIERHLSKKKNKFWHIDYLLDNKNVKVEKVFIKKGGKKEECNVAFFLSKVGKAVKGFGCSDCKCKSHLFKIDKFSIQQMSEIFSLKISEHD